MAKGTATSKQMMPRMETYGGQNNPGYQPPQGSAGSSAFGEYSTKQNPMSVPKKGSSIGPGYGNSDRMKAMSAKEEEARKESLRGQPC
jgi:hypothetical protein